MAHKLSDYDRWFKPCEHCGLDSAKVSAKSSNKCWKCGRRLQRDYSDRALKPAPEGFGGQPLIYSED